MLLYTTRKTAFMYISYIYIKKIMYMYIYTQRDGGFGMTKRETCSKSDGNGN